jgi:hypothetical protein
MTPSRAPTPVERGGRRAELWFLAWVVVGACGALGFVSFALWVFLVPAAVIGALLLAKLRTPYGSVAGLLAGAGLALLFVAYLQREGPGTTCWRTATGGGCAQHLDPRPWLVAGIAFLLTGVSLYWAIRRRASA